MDKDYPNIKNNDENQPEVNQEERLRILKNLDKFRYLDIKVIFIV